MELSATESISADYLIHKSTFIDGAKTFATLTGYNITKQARNCDKNRCQRLFPVNFSNRV